MNSDHVVTEIAADGLRYVAKAAGSPYRGVGSTLSCFLCGQHRARAALSFRKLAGKNHLVCIDACQAANARQASSTRS